MTNKFKDRVVLVTGGTSGIGKATALQFAKQGAKVVVAGRRTEEGQKVVAEIKAAGGQGLFIKTDVSIEADVRAMVDKTVATFGKLDIAFNNAGVEEPFSPVSEKTAEGYRHVMDINVLGVLLSMKYEVPAMLKNGWGSIINTSSVAGHVGLPSMSVYVASKHAVIGLTKTVALEVAKQNIRVNDVAPAAIRTEMFDRFASGEGVEEHMASLHPVGRIGTADEVANAVLWLADPANSFVTGQSIVVDGGMLSQ